MSASGSLKLIAEGTEVVRETPLAFHVPPLPLPELSAAVVPDVSSSFQYPTRPLVPNPSWTLASVDPPKVCERAVLPLKKVVPPLALKVPPVLLKAPPI